MRSGKTEGTAVFLSNGLFPYRDSTSHGVLTSGCPMATNHSLHQERISGPRAQCSQDPMFPRGCDSPVNTWGLIYEDLHGFPPETWCTLKSRKRPDVQRKSKHISFVHPNQHGIDHTWRSTRLLPLPFKYAN